MYWAVKSSIWLNVILAGLWLPKCYNTFTHFSGCSNSYNQSKSCPWHATLSQKKWELEFIFSPLFYIYTCTIELQSVGNPLKKMEITTYGKRCTKDNTFVEKKRGYLKPLWNSKSFLVLVFFYLHYPVLRDPFCKLKEALKLHTCFNLTMWREFWMALLFLWAKPINYYPNPFLLWCQTRRSAKMLDLSGVYWVSVMKKILVPATRVISQSYSQQVRSRKLLVF